MLTKNTLFFLFAMTICSSGGIAQWTQVGGNIGASSSFRNSSLAFSPSTNEAYIAYPDTAVSAYVVQKFNGTSWVQVGGNLGNASYPGPSLVFHPSSGEAYIAYYDPVATAYFIEKFNGTNWVQIGTAVGAIDGTTPALAFDPSSNEPYIAYGDINSHVIQKYNGVAWNQVGPGIGGWGAEPPSLIFHPITNEAYIGRDEFVTSSYLAQKFNGTNWSQVGTSFISSTFYTFPPSVTFHPVTNELYIACLHAVDNKIWVHKLNGNSWVQIGASFGYALNSIPKLVFNSVTNEPYVAYTGNTSNGPEVHRFNGTSWVQVGSSLGPLSGVGYSFPSFAFDPSSNEAYISYFEETAKTFIVRKYNCAPTTATDVQTACDSFLWMDGNTYTASNNTATHTLINADGCDSIVTLDLTINLANTNVTQSGNSLAADANGATYQWLDCDSNYAVIPGATNQTFTAMADGNYAVAINQNGCEDTSACYSVTIVGILQNDFGDGLLLYPNPTNGNISLDLGSKFESITITISDINGRIIQSNIYTDQRLINLRHENPAGTYFISIKSGDRHAVFRSIKE